MGGRSVAPAVASHVKPHTRPNTLATLQPIAGSAEVPEMGFARFSSLSNAYANRAAAKPRCQKIKSHDPVWIPAPRSPVGENAPEKVSACGMTISAVKRYPLASIKSEREREIENCANSRIEVIKSVTKTMASSDGKNALSSASGLPENGATAANAMSATAATAIADRLCRAVGGRSASHLSAPSVSPRAMTLSPHENRARSGQATAPQLYANGARLWRGPCRFLTRLRPSRMSAPGRQSGAKRTWGAECAESNQGRDGGGLNASIYGHADAAASVVVTTEPTCVVQNCRIKCRLATPAIPAIIFSDPLCGSSNVRRF